MNSNLEQKKESAVDDAIKLKEAGKRLFYIIGKFPDYESEIREVFGIVAFIKENNAKIFVPKNILKTILSKMTAGSPIQATPLPKKEITQDIHASIAEDEEYGGESPEIENNLMPGKWKIILPVVILAVITGITLLRSDSKKKDEIINQNIGTSQNSDELKK